MSIALILPSQVLTTGQLRRAARSTEYRFPGKSVAYAAHASQREAYVGLLGPADLVDRDDRQAMSRFEVVIYLEQDKNLIPTAYDGFRRGQPVYKVDYLGKLNRCSQLDDTDYPYFKTHPFNFVGPRHDDNFYYFPYGYLFRLTGMGPTNEFGHRINQDIEALVNRSANHILIAVFGGSAAWSIFSFYEEMFSYRLQIKLNDDAVRAGSNLKFTVINFGTPGNVVLNELTTYLLFCQRLKPNAVIAHDGFNDLYYGQVSHPHLLNKYAMTYQYNLENWSQILHETSTTALDWSKDNIPVINYPRVIVGSYLERVEQFRSVVHGSGTTFISGLQPMMFSKKIMSTEEAAWLPMFKPKEETFRNMRLLYDRYIESDPGRHGRHFVNFHAIFNEYGAEDTLLGDVMHTVPAGDEVIAAHYFEHMRDRLLPEWTAGVKNA
jgi:hypothetical protein